MRQKWPMPRQYIHAKMSPVAQGNRTQNCITVPVKRISIAHKVVQNLAVPVVRGQVEVAGINALQVWHTQVGGVIHDGIAHQVDDTGDAIVSEDVGEHEGTSKTDLKEKGERCQPYLFRLFWQSKKKDLQP